MLRRKRYMENDFKVKITKTNRRHKAHDVFDYYVTPQYSFLPYASSSTRSFKFNEWRIWAWETWGPSAERDSTFLRDQKELPLWAWHTEEESLRLYLRSEKELNWFKLRWT